MMNSMDSPGFAVNVGIGQDCVMFSWLFNTYMDAVIKEAKVRAQGIVTTME